MEIEKVKIIPSDNGYIVEYLPVDNTTYIFSSRPTIEQRIKRKNIKDEKDLVEFISFLYETNPKSSMELLESKGFKLVHTQELVKQDSIKRVQRLIFEKEIEN